MPDKPEPADFSESEIEQVAMRWLARRDYARLELGRRLRGRGMPSDRVEAVLDDLEKHNMQSDARFAETFVNVRVSRGQGPFRIRNELEERGVSGDLIQAVFEEAETDWFRLAVEVRRKKFGGNDPADAAQKARQMRFLRYRGFEADHIRRALNNDEFD